MLDPLVNLVLAGLVGLVCFGAGRTILLKSGFQLSSTAETVALGSGIGFATLVYAMVLIGFADLYRPAVAWGLLAVLALASAAGLKDRRWSYRFSIPRLNLSGLRSSWSLAAILTMLGAYALAYVIVALAPTLEGDSIAGYLVTPREYARAEGIVSVDYVYTNTYPANGQMLSTFGFVLRGQILAQLLVVWLMGLLAIGAIYAIGRTWLSNRAAIIAVAVWYGMLSVGYLATSAKIDLAWAAFDLLALLAFARWYFAESSEREWRWLVLAGLFLGVAGGVKQASLFTAMILAMAIAVRLWHDREGGPATWARAYFGLLLPASLAGIWVLRSYLLDGTLAFTASDFAGERGPIGFFRVVWQMSMLGNTGSLEGPLGKSVGPAILATLPLLVFLRGVNRRVWHLLAFCGLAAILWYIGVQRARHLLPTLGLLSLVSGYAVAFLLTNRPRFGTAVIALTVVALALNLGAWSYINLVSLKPIPYVLGLQDEDAFLKTNLPKRTFTPNHAIMTYAREQLPADARIAAVHSGYSYYLDRPFYDTWNHTPEDVPTPGEFADNLKAAELTHAFLSDQVIRARKLENAWLARPEFQDEFLEELVCDGGHCLYAVR